MTNTNEKYENLEEITEKEFIDILNGEIILAEIYLKKDKIYETMHKDLLEFKKKHELNKERILKYFMELPLTRELEFPTLSYKAWKISRDYNSKNQKGEGIEKQFFKEDNKGYKIGKQLFKEYNK